METTYEWESAEEDRTRMALTNRGRPSGFVAITTPVLVQAMSRANRKDLVRLKTVLESRQA